jgi:Nif-specific regulatory protein
MTPDQADEMETPPESASTGCGARLRERLFQLQQERDLYLALLGLNAETEPKSFLEGVLGLVVGAVGAKQGYLELFDPAGNDAAWRHATGFSGDEVERIRALVSRGVIAHAVATGTVVLTPAAYLDPRFNARESVQRSRLDVVLCAPIGADPPVGVLYLQGYADPAGFNDQHSQCVEKLAQLLEPIARDHLERQGKRQRDATSPYRERLRSEELVGKSPALGQLMRDIEAVARLDVTVLITGETGTGKSQVARTIHNNSKRAGRPFVAVNCAAIPENLIASELFGARKGAFSSALRDIEGRVSAARGGTLLLDEIGELSLPAQAMLLQFLQTKEYAPLGESQMRKADVRILAATNVNLREAVREKRFREDLLFRLDVLTIRVPSLSERREDVPWLAHHFCAQAAETHGLSNLELSPQALRALAAAEWRGNVRELENAVTRAAIRAAGQELRQIPLQELFPDTVDPRRPDAVPGSAAAALGTYQQETRRFQKELLQRALDSMDWKIAETAAALDLTRGHVYALIREFGLVRNR